MQFPLLGLAKKRRDEYAMPQTAFRRFFRLYFAPKSEQESTACQNGAPSSPFRARQFQTKSGTLWFFKVFLIRFSLNFSTPALSPHPPILDQPEVSSNLTPSGRAHCAFPFRFAPSNATHFSALPSVQPPPPSLRRRRQ